MNPPKPPRRRPAAASPPRAAAPAKAPLQPLDDDEVEQLQALLDEVPKPLEALDVSMLDGYLCGVLLQPKPVQSFRWTRHVLDAEEGRNPPDSYDNRPLLALVKRRYAELNQAIAERQWFDPLVFELDEDAEPSEVVLPWVAGFALATELFPELMKEDAADLLEPLASLFMHLDPDDLEDADDLLEEIETLEPPADVAEAVESLVRSTLLLADITRPLKSTEPSPRRVPAGAARRRR
ncbi:YecA family protein [Pelomonas sp. KK5]|uniref:YecA/YgfB family protein n=1 Tax=Pelomonas sp. KK5 TaxID=1855730 RepID=UPI0009F81434|nr:YecA family protein [Pelomonas sp. KK5]